MTNEEHESRLTAYALNDPGITATERREIEAMLGSDASARQAVEETRQLAQTLGESLAAEQAAMPATKGVTIPATKAVPRRNREWVKQLVAVSIVLLGAAGVSYFAWAKWKANKQNRLDHDVAALGLATEQFKSPNTGYYDPTPLPSAKSYTADNELATGERDKGDRTSPLRSPGIGDTVPTDQSTVKPTGGLPGQGVLGTPGNPVGPASPAPGLPGIPLPLPAKSRPVPGPVVTSPSSLPLLPKPDSNRESPAGLEKKPGEGLPYREDEQKGDGKGEKAEPGVSETRSNDRFSRLVENDFIKVEGLDALSTFGVDVDTASYSIVRKYLTMNQLPPASAVRLEEMVNYFPYADKAPDGDDPFAVTVEMAECPWQPKHRLVRLGLKAKPIASDKRPPSNLVFLIDVSGSMDEPNKLPLVKASLKLLVNQLGEKDRIAMVVYAGASGLVLDSTPATKKETILNALDQLSAGGSTNGAGGLQQAYDVAKANFIKGGTNRVILCTDGDWNVGTTSTEALVKMIEQKRETGVFLSVFGFGMGNLRDEMMVKLANKGNGNYGYIDQLKEAQKAFVEQMGGTLVTVAKDVKIQIEFNPAAIHSYRLLGYEKRLLAAQDFHDDKKDAGEMGAGHVVTALYELVPVGVESPILGKVDGLRYQQEPKPAVKSDKVNEAFVLKMRHKKPDSDTSTLREVPISNITKHYEKASEDFQFSAAVASFAMLLRDSAYKGSSNYALVLELAKAAMKHDPGGYRAEFVDLVKTAKSLSGK